MRGVEGKRIGVVVAGLVLAGLWAWPSRGATPAETGPAGEIDFSRDIRPILSNNCFQCHGPDAHQRQAGLRLDTQEGALAALESGATAVVPGDLEQSALVRRITASDPGERMPPADSEKQLTPEEIELLRRWVAAGAPWKMHWAFQPPRAAELPEVARPDWCRGLIDRFVLASLEQRQWSPEPEAARETLIRRVTLDLTGLPPTLEAIDAFLLDNRADAYEHLVDRLLASPRFGEHLARDWLDVARYGDTHGLHLDNERAIWPYRDWVISALNQNLPFDQFTVEQLAGDLLPEPTLSQQVATGFNRCNVTTSEGGAIEEEFRVRYAVDRVETTSTVFLGLTLGCAVCHDHKFDPFTQREFYQLFAYFNNVADRGMDGNALTPPPSVPVPSPEQADRQRQLREQRDAVVQALAAPHAELDTAQVAWEADWRELSSGTWQTLPPTGLASSGGATLVPLGDGSVLASGENPDRDVYQVTAPLETTGLVAIRLEALTDESLKDNGPGRSSNSNFVLSEIEAELIVPDSVDAPRPIRWASAQANHYQKQGDYRIEKAIDGVVDATNGWAAAGYERHEPCTAVFALAEPLTAAAGSQLRIRLRHESQFGQHAIGRFRLSISTDPRVVAPNYLEQTGQVAQVLAVPSADRTPEQAAQVRDFYRRQHWPQWAALDARRQQLQSELDELERQIPLSLVMRESDAGREAFVLIRGQYDQPGEPVKPGVPTVLPPLPADAPANRLALARWLVSPDHPLTARVAVNRFWQHFFGVGLVKTAEDFGQQGEFPTHPELLDTLARRFIESGWDVKGLLRQIVTSSTYRQSSQAAPAKFARDPENRWLARGPRYRLDAEVVRDLALATSGLLVEQLGGPGVKPYQPAGLWEAVAYPSSNTAKFAQDQGAALYRRSLYTFWKRTSPPPNMQAFDAPTREACTVRRSRTNTPLQALVLLNDVQFVEAARNLAQRIIRQGGATAQERASYGFRLATGRQPQAAELRSLVELYDDSLAEYRAHPDQARHLAEAGDSPTDEALDPVEVAATTVVANLLLNLDETVTKN